jgi:hypothetical protein
MKALKSKIHHHRKTHKRSHPVTVLAQETTEILEVDHDIPDADMLRFSMLRSPKQENL